MSVLTGENRRGKLTDRFVCVIQHLNRLMYSGRSDELKKLDLNAHHIDTLVLLDYYGPARMGTLASHLGSKLSHTSNIVDHLVGKGYLRRSSDPDDRRVVICELTKRGRKATEQFMHLAAIRANKVAEKWDLDQFESVVESLELLWRAEKEVQASVVSSQLKDKP
ncbi:MAG: MarR family transcriptional regulator [Gemmatimonadetes bacterium]|nr:MarR family transcriptional regulator [Gemmatimonadota bacterium]